MQVDLLGHGYVKLIPTGVWGSDELIVESARMSTDGAFRGWGTEEVPGDEKLLRRLWHDQHSSPFEMAGATFEVQCPLFVIREWQRHRTQSYNELSGRYAELPDLHYLPSVERLQAGRQSSTNRQGSEAGFSVKEAGALRDIISFSVRSAREDYEDLLSSGLARELARLVLPATQFTRMRASANLRNWLAFLTLRTDPAAQWEIRQYAQVIQEMLEGLFPRTLQLWKEKH